MSDYKEMYLTMMREAEKAIRILVEAQKNVKSRIWRRKRKKKRNDRNDEPEAFVNRKLMRGFP